MSENVLKIEIIEGIRDAMAPCIFTFSKINLIRTKQMYFLTEVEVMSYNNSYININKTLPTSK